MQPGGSLFITTINKTKLSYALAIVVAEQLLRIVPRGTHDWEKFISPEELERLLESSESLPFQHGGVGGGWFTKRKVSLTWCSCVISPSSDGFTVQSVQGMMYSPLSGAWSWTDSTAINYALHAVKEGHGLEDSSSYPEEHTKTTHS